MGWKREVLDRQIHVGPGETVCWFEENNRKKDIGLLRTTGVVIKLDNEWKITQLNTAMPIPNELLQRVADLIKEPKRSESSADESSPDKTALTPDQRKQAAESFEYIWNKVKDTYWDKDLGGVDWQAAHDELRPQLDSANSMSQARSVMNELVERMKVSHFAVIPKSAYEELGELDEPGSRGGTTGLDVRIVDNQILVVGVDPESAAFKAGVQPGWIVEKIDEIDTARKLAEVSREIEGNPLARTILASAAISRLRGNVGDKITVSFRDGKNELQEIPMEMTPQRGEKVQFGHIPEFRVWHDARTIDHDIGYFRFNAFMDPVQVMTAYSKFIMDHLDAPGIIIDVRGNGGGSGEIAMGMIGWLMTGEKKLLGKVVFRNDELKLFIQPRPTTYQGKVALLIDESSVSAAEFFARGIKDLTNSRLIGTRTAGAVLGSQIERLPNGDGFQFAAVNFISEVTGDTLEGVGVSPDQEIQPDRAMLLDGRDSAIEAAVHWIVAPSN
jgi:C-terminal processing protease CtpA/Prc